MQLWLVLVIWLNSCNSKAYGQGMAVISSESGPNLVAGASITLTCAVPDIEDNEDLQSPTLDYVWERDGETIAGETLMLGPLTAADIGSYTCTVTISDVTLSTNITVTSQGYSLNVFCEHGYNNLVCS